MIVDMRMRPPLKTWVTTQQYSSTDTPTQLTYSRPPSGLAKSMDMLLKEMDEAEMQWGVIMGRQSMQPNGSIPNDEIFDCVKQYPDRFVGWAGLDLSRPTQWWIEEINRCAKLQGCKGVSIEPTQAISYATRTAGDRRLYPIYEECQRLELPLSISLSGLFQAKPHLRLHDASPATLFQVARDFPALQIVCSHAGWPFVTDMIALAFTRKNVWISPDLYMSPELPFSHEYLKAANHSFSNRTLFGTAYPVRDVREMVQMYRRLDWIPGVLDKVLSMNALRLMKMD